MEIIYLFIYLLTYLFTYGCGDAAGLELRGWGCEGVDA